MTFRDPYGKTRMSGRKTLLFCGYNGFVIPHDVAGAILYADAIDGLAAFDFDGVLPALFNPSLRSFVADSDWYLGALRDMGYDDIVRGFNRLDKKIQKYIKNNLGTISHDELKEKIVEMIPQKYICKKPRV